MKDILTRTDRRVAILDIEASALGAGSYPIEVGVALVQGGPKLIETGARIIRPTPSWRKSGTWSPASEAVHGLSVETLNQHGHDPSEVCDWLNALRSAVAGHHHKIGRRFPKPSQSGGVQFTLLGQHCLRADFSKAMQKFFMVLRHQRIRCADRSDRDACGITTEHQQSVFG